MKISACWVLNVVKELHRFLDGAFLFLRQMRVRHSYFIPAFLLFSLNSPLLQGETNQDIIASPANYLASVYKMLSSQSSLSVVATEEGHLEPGFPDLGHDQPMDIVGTFKLFYKGDQFLYNIEIVGPSGPSYSKVESFDGKSFEMLDRSANTLSISSKKFLNDVVMSEGHFLFMPFLFLEKGFATNAFAQLSYSQLIDLDQWRKAMEFIQTPGNLQEVTVDKERYFKATNIGSHVDRVLRKPCSFDVLFARNLNGYPTKWEEKTPTGEIVASYSVEEVGYLKLKEGINMPYPKKSLLKHYLGGALTDTIHISITDLKFGGVLDEDVSIDPASASRIRDLDHGTLINVPK